MEVQIINHWRASRLLSDHKDWMLECKDEIKLLEVRGGGLMKYNHFGH